MAKEADAEHAYFLILRVAMTAFNKGIPPLMAVDMGRRAVPTYIRPSFQEMETACRKKVAAAPPPGKDAAA